MRPLFVILLLAAFPMSVAHADDCDNPTSQMAMNQCADQEFRKADAQLNVVYRQIRERLKDDKEKTQLLVKAEKAWLAFRDAECDFSSSGSAGGTAHPMLVALCRTGRTNERLDQLKKSYLNCKEGDLSCPLPPS